MEEINQLVSAMQKRGADFNQEQYQNLLFNKKQLIQKTEKLQQQRNTVSKEIGLLKQSGQDASEQMQLMQNVNQELEQAKQSLNDCLQEFDAIFQYLPNPLDPRVPTGESEDDNKVIKTWSEPKKFDFDVLDHVDLGLKMNGMDFETASQNSRSRFVYLTGKVASLHRALTQWMLDTHTKNNGYQEVYVPLLVNKNTLTQTCQLPKFAEDLFFTEDGLGLIPTSEVPLVAMYANTMLSEQDLPIKLTAHSPCFRSEAGSYGKDTRGMIRQHQFDKVELVQIVSPDQAESAHLEILAQAEQLLEALDLPYRTILKCSADTGFHASITYDIEVWLPSQNTYREISSISQCSDFQAKRMKCRYKGKNGKNWVHTLNGSGLAVGRTLVAVLENHQLSDGSIKIPEVLEPYLAGKY